MPKTPSQKSLFSTLHIDNYQEVLSNLSSLSIQDSKRFVTSSSSEIKISLDSQQHARVERLHSIFKSVHKNFKSLEIAIQFLTLQNYPEYEILRWELISLAYTVELCVAYEKEFLKRGQALAESKPEIQMRLQQESSKSDIINSQVEQQQHAIIVLPPHSICPKTNMWTWEISPPTPPRVLVFPQDIVSASPDLLMLSEHGEVFAELWKAYKRSNADLDEAENLHSLIEALTLPPEFSLPPSAERYEILSRIVSLSKDTSNSEFEKKLITRLFCSNNIDNATDGGFQIFLLKMSVTNEHTTKSNVANIISDEQFQHLAGPDSQRTTIANFFADWAEQCKDMNEVFNELSNKFPKLQFIKVEAEEFPDISESLEIAAVPTFLVLKAGEILERLEGANAPLLLATVEKYTKLTDSQKLITEQTTAALTPEQLNNRLKTLINSNKVMVFLKGTPAEPRCGFSRQVVELLTEQRTTYGSFNILADDTVRSALKEYSNWPTYPQIYVDGELIGGLDILKEMIASGDFQKIAPPEDDINARLKELINKASVVLFMKGNPDAPRCGFSRQIVALLREQSVKFDYFDILEDDEVRQNLKVFSNWPTYPQLYSKGELLGGLDIVKEMIESGDFASALD
ncbi:Glutaredoxin 3 [Physocladia obscura]|uniref:Glutaredoxin 3 n=1 Tax=Physocladia obscura TaxID=109957 RepID=A0AAD5SZQ9_9FUNG|nr:Glutaredoxin 3 [Physocladia obscura]